MKTIFEVLEEIDNEILIIDDEHHIAELLKKAVPDGYELKLDERAELVAFSIGEYDPSQASGWGGYFGPGFIWSNQEGEMIESPARDIITKEMVSYWRKRLDEVKHPILAARYAGLTWHLPKALWGDQREHGLMHKHIEAQFVAIKNDLYKRKTTGIGKLQRLFKIITSFNDTQYFERIKTLILWYEQTFGLADKPGLWAFSYDLLSSTKKLKMTNEEMQDLICRLEGRLNILKTGIGEPLRPNPWAAQVAAEQLADYYVKQNDMEAVKRVLLAVGEAYEPLFPIVSRIQEYGWLEQVYFLYCKYHLKDEADGILCRLRDIGEKASEGMTTHQHSIEISKDELQELADIVLQGTNDEVFRRIFTQFIPSREIARGQLKVLAKEVPMQFLFPTVIQGTKGRTAAVIGGIENDLEGNIIVRISESLQFFGLFLNFSLKEGEKRGLLTKETVMEFISKSAAIDPIRLPIFERSINAYFDKDYLIFIHLLIPQIEEAIRNMVEKQGGTVYKVRDKIFNLRTLDDILSEDKFKEIFGESGENIQTYLKVMLTDRRGWNIRNEVSHGLLAPESFNAVVADRILHVVLLLGLVRKTEGGTPFA